MGFFSRGKEIGGTIFNFRVTQWMGLKDIKHSYGQLRNIAGSLVRPEQAERSETFEEALERLQLTEAELQQRRTEFTRLMFIYVAVAVAIFMYSVWIAYAHKNIYGFFMGLGLTVYALTLAFRYHFWIFQIKNKKLGCTLKDWFFDIK